MGLETAKQTADCFDVVDWESFFQRLDTSLLVVWICVCNVNPMQILWNRFSIYVEDF